MSLCINPHCSNPENKDTLLFCQSCGSELLLDGRYRVMGTLGGGGFGKTYEAKDYSRVTLGNNVGGSEVKVLKILTNNHPKYLELFEREAQFLARFNHPGIPKVEPDAYFLFYPRNSPEAVHCLVMEKIEGLDLREYMIQRGASISQKRAINWLKQLAIILREIHSYNFFHRDIKPSNIMLRPDGQLVLIDFGTARELSETYLSKESAGQGTGLFSAGYSPLEQLNGHAVLQSDFFALGRTFVYLLTGQSPSDLYDAYIDELQWRSYAPSLSPQFADFIDHLMARSPNQRPASADIIIQELNALHRTLYNTDTHSQTQLSNSSVPISERTKIPKTQTHNNPPGVDPLFAAQPTVLAEKTTAPIPLSPPPLPSTMTVVEASSLSQPTLDPNFIASCQQQLAEYIGPMASIICQRILSKNPQISDQEFVKALAQKIPDPQQAKAFQQKLLQGTSKN